MNVTIFGLGLHGGGVSAARYFASRGHAVTVTDLRDASVLQESLSKLSEFSNITSVLGTHRLEDFQHADLVIKNTAVAWDNPMLQYCSQIETDLSWFLERTKRPITAVTGTKGKTTSAAIVHHLLLPSFPNASIAGNMGISLFDIADEDSPDPAVLEISSWQLRDLRMLGRTVLPRTALLTSLFPDHLNSYASMEGYIQDKAYLFSSITGSSILPASGIHPSWITRSENTWYFGPSAAASGISSSEGRWSIYDRRGEMLCSFNSPDLPFGVYEDTAMGAVLCAFLSGADMKHIEKGLASFPPIPHRMEEAGSFLGIRWINDSASTVPQSVLRAVSHVPPPVHLITGGTDKGLSAVLYGEIFPKASSVHLLAGSFTRKITDMAALPYYGPFYTMEEAVESAFESARKLGGTVLLSPGASSFEHFRHEFDRGTQFLKAVQHLGRGHC